MDRLTRRDLLQRTGIAAGALVSGGNPGAGPPHRQNVLVLKSDEHNPLVSSVHGHPMARTPNMERLARMGTVFENHYCVSPLCLPSRSAYLSGRYPHEIQAYSNCTVFRSDHPCYGQILREQGVHTVHIGKMDVYQVTAKLGFSEALLSWDRPGPGDTFISRHPLAVRTEAHLRADGYGVRKDNPNPHAEDEQAISRAIEWLERNGRSPGKPWTLEVNIGAPHFPHYVTQEEWDAFPTGGDLPRRGREEESARHPIAADLRRHFETDLFREADIRGLRRGYLGCVSFVDRQLGRLLDACERLGLARETVIAYTSDHGEMLGEFGMWWKCSLYEDSARAPLIVAGPGFRKGARVKTAVNQHDLLASVFHTTGSRMPGGWHGAPLQTMPDDDPRHATFAEYHGHGARCSSYLIRQGRWKLIYHTEAPHQLFDLAADPLELRNLASKQPEVLRNLTAELRRLCDPERENRRAEAYIQAQLRAAAAPPFSPGAG